MQFTRDNWLGKTNGAKKKVRTFRSEGSSLKMLLTSVQLDNDFFVISGGIPEYAITLNKKFKTQHFPLNL